jgi:hypothetical protein
MRLLCVSARTPVKERGGGSAWFHPFSHAMCSNVDLPQTNTGVKNHTSKIAEARPLAGWGVGVKGAGRDIENPHIAESFKNRDL